jgi:hypothetical protein
MSLEKYRESDPCVVPGVQPFLSDLQQAVSLQVHDMPGDERAPVERFIRRVFRHCYGARLDSLYPTLLAFSSAGKMRAAVGVRAAGHGPLFAEHYLPAPAETLISDRWGQAAARRQLVEVGNLALAGPGDARWLIAAVTTFLHACGYRWVLFTAVRPLVNAFQRLGLSPVLLGDADPACLPDGGRDWGSYYEQRPVVCVGDIHSGFRKLSAFVSESQPLLHALLGEALRQAVPAHAPQLGLREGAR